MALSVGCAIVALAGCGSGGGTSSAGGSASSTTSSASAGTPVKGGDLVFANPQDAKSLDEANVFDNNSIWIIEQITQPLFIVTANGKGVQPLLASSYTISKDGKTYTIKLRQGVKFSDGTPMTSADVKFTLETTMAAKAGWGFIDTAIKSVAAPDPDTVVLTLKYAWAPMLADLALFANGIVPNNYGGKSHDAFYQAPVGTGPYKWDYWHKGSALKLVKNTDYWEPGKPYLNSVTWTYVPDDNTRELQVKAGQAQIDQYPAWSTVAGLKSTPGVTLSLFPSTETTYLGFNENVKPFQDVHVRRAISYAIDRTALVKAVLFGNGTAANSIFPPQVPYYDASSGGLQLDTTQAKAELAKSSVPHGFTTTLQVPSGNSEWSTDATIIQSELKPLGINVQIQQVDANTAHNNVQAQKYEMAFSLWTMDIPDPDELATFALDPNAGSKSFFTSYNNPAVVKAVHDAELTTAPSARQADYNTAQTESAQDAFLAFLYYSPYQYVETSNVHGFNVTPLGNYHMEDVWLSPS
jgi:peptide/nickel transport system substrate-binding protein